MLYSMHTGTPPIVLDLAALGISSGNHILRITATDITGLTETSVTTFAGMHVLSASIYSVCLCLKLEYDMPVLLYHMHI